MKEKKHHSELWIRLEAKKTPKRKNERPEKTVELLVRAKLKELGYFMTVIESKAVWSKSAGMYLHSKAAAGFSDLVGVSPMGRFVAIELKAPGKRSTVSKIQRDFLANVIKSFGVGLVVDSVENLTSQLDKINALTDAYDQQVLMLKFLPTERVSKFGDLNSFLD